LFQQWSIEFGALGAGIGKAKRVLEVQLIRSVVNDYGFVAAVEPDFYLIDCLFTQLGNIVVEPLRVVNATVNVLRLARPEKEL